MYTRTGRRLRTSTLGRFRFGRRLTPPAGQTLLAKIREGTAERRKREAEEQRLIMEHDDASVLEMPEMTDPWAWYDEQPREPTPDMPTPSPFHFPTTASTATPTDSAAPQATSKAPIIGLAAAAAAALLLLR